MSTARVERMLDQIARLSREEQSDLMRNLARALGQVAATTRAPRGHLAPEAVSQAVEMRERIRRRLLADGQRPGSIAADLDDFRESPLDGAPGMSATREGPAQ